LRRRNTTRWLATAAALLSAGAGAAADLELPPEKTAISFELDSTLHRVHGRARLEQGAIQFDPDGGTAAGRIVIDATSLDTDNGLRDAQMHEKVLESARFPRIELLPDSLLVEQRDDDHAQVVLVGRVRIHGGEWPVRIPATVETLDQALHVSGSFEIPYVQWGMRDMSNFLLSVDPVVSVHFESQARVRPEIAALTGAGR
jgi:polyisoprenoid-binding protein YceI